MLQDGTKEWEEVHEALEKARRKAGLSKSRLAAAAGIHRANYHSMEVTGNPRLSTLARLSKALGGRLSISF